MGLTRDYRDTSSPSGKWLHYVFGLTFLPPDEVGDAFVELMEERPIDSRLTEFCDYLVDYYIQESSSFPPHIWAALVYCPWRTTNACESFHARFNAACPSPHPNINTFLKCINDVQIDTYVKITSINCRTIRQPKSFILEKIRQFNNHEIDRLNFVKCVSYKYNAVENK